MAYSKVNWTEAVPITPANLDTMDQGVADVDATAGQLQTDLTAAEIGLAAVELSDYRRGGRVLVGYYDRGAAGSSVQTSIEMPIPAWARNFISYEIFFYGRHEGGDADFPLCYLLTNTTSVSGNSGAWNVMEEWRATAGAGSGGQYAAASNNNQGWFGRVGSVTTTARAQLTRLPGAGNWIVSSSWGGSFARSSGSNVLRMAQGTATSERVVSGALESLMLWVVGGSVNFSSTSRAALYAVPRPGDGTDNIVPGAPA